jgi:23S rRNA (uracil1939-C5)-methyltransferase
MIHCSHFSFCGGCSLPNVPYAEQLALKRAQLSSLLKLDVPPLVPSPRDERFRHKVAFVFGADASGRRIVMGHYAAQTRTIVPIDECPVHSDRGNQLAFALRDELVRARVPPALLRHVLIRTTESGREAVVMLVVARNDRVLRAPVRAFLARKNPPDGFFINVHDRPGPAMVGRETIRIAGRAHAREDALGASFLIGPTAFFQTNVGAAGEVLRLVMEDVAGARSVLDLYSGSGLFTVPMAASGMSVTAVEEHPQASEDAARNLRLNRVPDDRVRLIRARVEDALPRLSRTRFDAIVIDPPRQGCAAPVLPAIVQDLKPPRLIYVSCNPQVLAADIPLIRRAGYTIARLQPVDMFPHTEHIETVVTFRRD